MVSGGTGTTPLAVTFTSNASRAAVQALLRAITFQVVGEAPSTATRTVRFVVNDGRGGTSTSAAATRQVTVTAVNDPPVNTMPGPQTTPGNTPRVF
jgi:hypothetical protein